MNCRKLATKQDRREVTKAIVSFSALVHAWKTGQHARIQRHKRELGALGVRVEVPSVTPEPREARNART